MTGAHLFSFEKKWKLWNDCLEGSFVSGFRVAYHPMMGLDGFDVTCTTKHGSEVDWLVHHSLNANESKSAKLLTDLQTFYHCTNNDSFILSGNEKILIRVCGDTQGAAKKEIM